MLKLVNNPQKVTLKNKKCAEVFYQDEENFSFVCIFCEIKIFDFGEFLIHFKNAHLISEDADGHNANSFETVTISNHGDNCKSEVTMKCEVDEGEDFYTTTKEPEMCLKAYYDDGSDTVDHNYDHEDDEIDNNDADMEEYVPTIMKAVKALLKKPKKAELNIKPECQECDNKPFRDVKALKTHIKNCHKRKTDYPCTKCSKVYKTKSARDEHEFKHTGQRSFQCTIDGCGKFFLTPKTLRVHKHFVHFSEANLICEICGYRTKKTSALENHKRKHTGEKPHICKICGKCFRLSSLLNEHLPIHSEQRPHQCDVCGASFSRRKALYHHKDLHLSIKKHVCKLCGKAYSQAAGLSAHMRQHKAEQCM